MSKNSLQKTECGTYHFCCTDSISLTSWNDNSACEVSSNCYHVEATGKVQRWVKAKGPIEVSQPNAITVYNELKRGVFFLYVNILNVSLVAACSPLRWQCSNHYSKKTHLQIWRYITLVLIKSEDETRINQKKSMARKLQEVTKTDKAHKESALAHWGRCFFCEWNIRFKCKKCGVKLHHDWNSLYWFVPKEIVNMYIN